MEFPFHSCEDRDAYFSAPHSIRRTPKAAGGLVRAGVGPMSAREALQRELQKERIREELIAREIAARRALEEEVRRELELEREFAIRRRLLQVEMPPRTSLAEERMVSDLVAPSDVPELKEVDERLPPTLHAAPTRIIKPPPSAQPEQPKKESSPAPEIKPSELNVTATKRKAPEVTSEWGCALCHVRSTSKQALDEHLQGKRHKAKEELLGKDVPASRPAKEQTTDEEKNKKLQVIRCELCSVECNSEVMMASHLQGKKHRAHLNGSNMRACEARASVEDVKEVMDQVAEEEKREDPPKIDVGCVPAEKEEKEDTEEQMDGMKLMADSRN